MATNCSPKPLMAARTTESFDSGFFGVFSLAMASKARIHFFGRYGDVVATAYLVEVCLGKIERACDAHIESWKREAPRTAGQTRSERVAFCDNAVIAFGRKLREIRIAAGEDPDRALDAAEDFARDQHARRGLSWGIGGHKSVRHHAAGAQAGRALQVVRGMNGRPTPRLTGR